MGHTILQHLLKHLKVYSALKRKWTWRSTVPETSAKVYGHTKVYGIWRIHVPMHSAMHSAMQINMNRVEYRLSHVLILRIHGHQYTSFTCIFC